LDKNTKIKFDHIIAYTGHYGENDDETKFDPYLDKSTAVMNEVFTEKGVPLIEWYSHNDCEHTFPSLHHLEKFLDVLGVEKDELQPEPTEGN
jgi:hypothetical protein